MKLLAAVLAALAFPSAALGEATLVTRELPVGGARTLAATDSPTRFNLLGLHWRGSGRVLFRVRRAQGWSPWHEAEADDLPDRGSEEARRMRGWRIGSPWWTDTAERVQVRTRGRVQRVRAHFVWSPEQTVLERSLQTTDEPAIILRRGWGANEGIRRGDPRYAATLQTAIVHHTAGAAGTSPAQSAAIVRAIQTYHVRGNGWDDIGYNFLVDRFGQVFEGRYGGIERNVVGAHAQGFNTGSVGIALLGSYGGAVPPAKARDALARLIAWRLDVAHVDPVSRISVISSGNPRFPAGLPTWMRAVSGHRDTGFTSCPGAGLYGQLGSLAGRARAIGLPKLFTPEVEGSPGGFVSFSARLSNPLAWTVIVADSTGRQVAMGAGFGTAVQWTWDARLAPPGAYTYQIAAGLNVRPAEGTIGASAGAVSISTLRAEPAGFTPNGDGLTDETRITYRLGAPATVNVDLQAVDGTPIALLASGPKSAGSQVFVWNGGAYPDGRYRIVVTARGARGRQVAAATSVVLSRTLSGFVITPTALSPNADGRNDTASVAFSLLQPAFARLQVLRGSAQVVRPLYGPLPAGPQTLTWPGGVRDGDYTVALMVTDAVGPVTQLVPMRVDRVRPRLTLVSRRPLRVSLSEPARVTVLTGSSRITFLRAKAGAFRVLAGASAKRVVAFAEDAARNVSPRLRLR
ncbi:MAG: N-acetylmuramoyl-L-alanine amidase [Gaiellales bacterium]